MRLPRFLPLRFSVRALLIAIAIFSVWLGREVRYYDRRIKAVEHFTRRAWDVVPGGNGLEPDYHFFPSAVQVYHRIGWMVIRAHGEEWGNLRVAGERIRGIEFGGREFNDDDFRQLVAFPEIESLDLVGTSISDAIAPLFRNFPNLKALKLGRYYDLEGLPESVLVWHEIDGPGITDKSIKYLRALSKLENLGLNGAHVTDAGVRELVSLPNLMELELCGTDVTTACIDDILRMPRLKNVAVDENVYPHGDKRRRPGLKINGDHQTTE